MRGSWRNKSSRCAFRAWHLPHNPWQPHRLQKAVTSKQAMQFSKQNEQTFYRPVISDASAKSYYKMNFASSRWTSLIVLTKKGNKYEQNVPQVSPSEFLLDGAKEFSVKSFPEFLRKYLSRRACVFSNECVNSLPLEVPTEVWTTNFKLLGFLKCICSQT